MIITLIELFCKRNEAKAYSPGNRGKNTGETF